MSCYTLFKSPRSALAILFLRLPTNLNFLNCRPRAKTPHLKTGARPAWLRSAVCSSGANGGRTRQTVRKPPREEDIETTDKVLLRQVVAPLPLTSMSGIP